MNAPLRRLIVAAILLVAIVAGCSGSDEGDAAAGGMAPPAARELAGEDAVADTAAEFSTGGGGGDSSAQAVNSTQTSALPERVIKTAQIEIEVEDGELGSAIRKGREIAEAAGGFVLSTSVEGDEEGRGELVIRVPAGDFGEAMSALEKLGKVAAETVRGEDVSQEFVDLEARLRNATAQETVLFRLYDRSNTIADTIRVQRELEDVQLEIERLRGRLRFLSDQTDLSTISMTAYESGAVVAEAGPFEKAWDSARKTFVAVVSGAIVGAGFLLPLVVFALLAYAVFRLVRPRLQRAAS